MLLLQRFYTIKSEPAFLTTTKNLVSASKRKNHTITIKQSRKKHHMHQSKKTKRSLIIVNIISFLEYNNFTLFLQVYNRITTLKLLTYM